MDKYHSDENFTSEIKCRNCGKNEKFYFDPTKHSSLPKIRKPQIDFCPCDLSEKSVYLRAGPKSHESDRVPDREDHV